MADIRWEINRHRDATMLALWVGDACIYATELEGDTAGDRLAEAKLVRAGFGAAPIEDQLEELEEHLPEGFDIGDDATTELALKCAELEHTIDMMKEQQKGLVLCPDPVTGYDCKTVNTLHARLEARDEQIEQLEIARLMRAGASEREARATLARESAKLP